MRRLLLILLTILLSLLLALGAVVVGLNTAPGQRFAQREINRLAGPDVQISGLSGHFPADIKLARLRLADKSGIWLTGTNLELRWHPLALLHRTINIAQLRAATINFTRMPQPGKNSAKKSGSAQLSALHFHLAQLDIGQLNLAPALAGEEVALHVTGAAQIKTPTQGALNLDATTPDGAAHYHIAAAFTRKNASLALQLAEPPDGLLGHFAGPSVHAPLRVKATLSGPRDAADLNFSMALGNAQLQGQGTLGLTPDHPFADVNLTVPALAPFGAPAGSSKLHLTVKAKPDGGANLKLTGDAALQGLPSPFTNLLGPKIKLFLQAELRGKNIQVKDMQLTGSQFSALAHGHIDAKTLKLDVQLNLPHIQAIAPDLSGNIQAQGQVSGNIQDFALQAGLTGIVSAPGVPSGPFSLSLQAKHLPAQPSGTLTGAGALENAPLLLNASFAQYADGTAELHINDAHWRSLTAKADLKLAPDANLPTGTASFTISRLADLNRFSPTKLQGAAEGRFTYAGGHDFKLALTTKNLVVNPKLGALDTSLQAAGPPRALSVKAHLRAAALQGRPAQMDLSALVDLPARKALLNTLHANWHGLRATLLGPARIETKPDFAVRSLRLALAGGNVGVTGSLWPRLDATATAQNIALTSLSQNLFPSQPAQGTLTARAVLTGKPAAPRGFLTLSARGLHLQTGAAAGLPPANLGGKINFEDHGAKIDFQLTAGPNLVLAARGAVPLNETGQLAVHVTGHTNLKLLNPLLAVRGSKVRGTLQTALFLTGTPKTPRAAGTLNLAGGSVENVTNGLNLTHISAKILAAQQQITLQSLTARAGHGTLSGQGTVNLGQAGFPVHLSLQADKATPIASDLVTETLDAALTLTGKVEGAMRLAGTVNLDQADINIPRGLPPNVANLPIVYPGTKPRPPAPKLPVTLDINLNAPDRIFVRGDGLFAELGGHVHVGGTLSDPAPSGGFELIRGNLSLAGKHLHFTSGRIELNGADYTPTLDLEASTPMSGSAGTARLKVSGTAAKPRIELSSTPPLPSDEVLAQLIFGESITSLSPFQAASLAGALAQLSGVGSSLNPLDKVRSALGLDELSLSGSGSGPPSVQAGRYVAPGVYVGATQATNGQGTQAQVKINLTKGLKLQTSTGTTTGGGQSSSVGLSYQFNY